MYRRDYLVRMIEQFTVTLGQVMFQRQQRRFQEAMELLTQAMKQLLGLNSKMVRALSAKDVIALLTTNGYFDAGKGLLLSDMLKAEGELLAEAGDEPEGRGIYLKALELLLEMRWMQESRELTEDIGERVEALLPLVSQVRKTGRLSELLIDYYEAAGQLSKAEDSLFFMLEDDPGNAAIVERGLEMYERWQKLEPSELEAGNLSEEEIRDSYALLVKMKR
ncbi:DUF6483 family protein [Paenibacillus doosanensis]|uniref:Tetratricopeptide repeat protein n=1 Tax=Paenibacillus konkukensis TaxID=2020716 RepID=A0ABY4RS23_9BACL|nr:MULTISPECIES: DUF6483 family protein [Paenibacillus]MCS7463746.1 DUF6483 family protein [Paenibacillus doosanensis]UQZ85242.1 hypothetical protein SK3146_04531 [Paenibacillus konkukensis]